MVRGRRWTDVLDRCLAVIEKAPGAEEHAELLAEGRALVNAAKAERDPVGALIGLYDEAGAARPGKLGQKGDPS